MSWFPGAMLREVDLVQTPIVCNLVEGFFPTTVLRCDVGGMIIGRRMPLNLEVMLEDGSFMALTVSNTNNYSTHITTAKLQGSLPLDLDLAEPLRFRLGTGSGLTSPNFVLQN